MSVETVSQSSIGANSGHQGVNGRKSPRTDPNASPVSGADAFSALLSSLSAQEGDPELLAVDDSGVADPLDLSLSDTTDTALATVPDASLPISSLLSPPLAVPVDLGPAIAPSEMLNEAPPPNPLLTTQGDSLGYDALRPSKTALSVTPTASATSDSLPQADGWSRDFVASGEDQGGDALLSNIAMTEGIAVDRMPKPSQQASIPMYPAVGPQVLDDAKKPVGPFSAKDRARMSSAGNINAPSAPAIAVQAPLSRFEGQAVRDVVAADLAPQIAKASGVESLSGVGFQADNRQDRNLFKPFNLIPETNSFYGGSADISQPGTLGQTATISLESGGVTTDSNAVEHWITNEVSNAEIKMDGIGDGAVEVSISVHGKEAHVSFRTDEVQTREVLEDAGATLKDMLQKEGLNLLGMSVGTSGSDGGPAQRHANRGRDGMSDRDQKPGKVMIDIPSVLSTGRGGRLDVYA